MRPRTVAAVVLVLALAALVAISGCAVFTATVAPKAHVVSDKPCAECHPFHHGIAYQGPCENCHVTSSWKVVAYKHKKAKLMDVGMHAVMGCSFCHLETTANPNPDCRTCHHNAHAGKLACSSCHTPVGFRVPVPPPAGHLSLEGGHAGLTCLVCHTKIVANKTYNCVDCHGVQHGGLTDCAKCHTPAGFKLTTFKHDSVFALLGVHATLDCAKCHPNREFAKVPGTHCVDCHGAQHGGLTQCQDCHTTSAFIPTTFRHSRVFLLVGFHATLDCSACHPDNKFAIVPGTDCVDCHGPQHGGLTDCGSCHNTSSFVPATLFNHSSFFPLIKIHSTLACSQCHPGNLFAQVAGTNCVDCHGPHHGGLTQCQDCHTPAGFVPATLFNHSNFFPLVGTHATLACNKCHPGNLFAIVPGTDCVDCHGVHHGNQTRCYLCHQPTTFADTLPHMPHPSSFPLTGHHATIACNQCHPGNIFTSRLGNKCVDCHGAHHGPTLTDCKQCHTPAGFTPANFNHASVFPLVGTHATLACNQCHTLWPIITVAGTNCVDCHGIHHGNQTECQTCHTPATNFNNVITPVPHPAAFPILGPHAAFPLPTRCTLCHQVVSGQIIFNGPRTPCVTCHLTDVNGAHTNPTDCERCHTTSPGFTPNTFNHATTSRPLTGTHGLIACTACHTTGHFQTPPPTCTPCH